jgi:hypothetical protein
MVRNKLLALEPWRPFFWDRWLATGVYLRALRRPALLPSGHEVDEEIYFAVSLIPKVEIKALRFVGYAFRLDPGTHTSRSVRREGYWHFCLGEATSLLASINVLECVMPSLQKLAFGQSLLLDYPKGVLNDLIAWKQRMTLADRDLEAGIKEFPNLTLSRSKTSQDIR